MTSKKDNFKTLKGNFEFEKDYNLYESMSNIEKLIYSIYLSIYICYYLRLTNKNLRYELINRINDIKFNAGHPKFTFADFTKMEQEF